MITPCFVIVHIRIVVAVQQWVKCIFSVSFKGGSRSMCVYTHFVSGLDSHQMKGGMFTGRDHMCGLVLTQGESDSLTIGVGKYLWFNFYVPKFTVWMLFDPLGICSTVNSLIRTTLGQKKVS